MICRHEEVSAKGGIMTDKTLSCALKRPSPRANSVNERNKSDFVEHWQGWWWFTSTWTHFWNTANSVSLYETSESELSFLSSSFPVMIRSQIGVSDSCFLPLGGIYSPPQINRAEPQEYCTIPLLDCKSLQYQPLHAWGMVRQTAGRSKEIRGSDEDRA